MVVISGFKTASVVLQERWSMVSHVCRLTVSVWFGFAGQKTENRCNQTTQGSPMVVACVSGTSEMMV